MNECDNMKRQEVKQHIDPWIREKKYNLIIPGSSTKKGKKISDQRTVDNYLIFITCNFVGQYCL